MVKILSLWRNQSKIWRIENGDGCVDDSLRSVVNHPVPHRRGSGMTSRFLRCGHPKRTPSERFSLFACRKTWSILAYLESNTPKSSAIHIDEIVEVTNEDIPYHTGADGHGWLDANGWLHRTAHVINSKNGNIYQITMDIAKARDGRFIMYALNGKTKKVGNAEANSLKIRGSSQNSNFGDNVAQNKPTVKVDYSLSDSDGRQLTKEQQDFVKDSKVVDENGNLKVVYHGSPSDFNTFRLEYLGANGTAEGYGFYFTDKKSIAENYSRGREGQQNGEVGKLFEVYLDIKKPLSDTEVTMSRAQFRKFLTMLNKQVDADGERLDILSNYGDVEWEGLNKVLNYATQGQSDIAVKQRGQGIMPCPHFLFLTISLVIPLVKLKQIMRI